MPRYPPHRRSPDAHRKEAAVGMVGQPAGAEKGGKTVAVHRAQNDVGEVQLALFDQALKQDAQQRMLFGRAEFEQAVTDQFAQRARNQSAARAGGERDGPGIIGLEQEVRRREGEADEAVSVCDRGLFNWSTHSNRP